MLDLLDFFFLKISAYKIICTKAQISWISYDIIKKFDKIQAGLSTGRFRSPTQVYSVANPKCLTGWLIHDMQLFKHYFNELLKVCLESTYTWLTPISQSCHSFKTVMRHSFIASLASYQSSSQNGMTWYHSQFPPVEPFE